MSLLSGFPIRIDQIRSDMDNPGLSDYEVSLLQIAEKITNGTVIDISYTGTTVLIRPGSIIGGKFQHECSVSRGLGYYLEFLISLAPFSKNTVEATLFGVTNNSIDLSVDSIRTVTLPTLLHFGIDSNIELLVKKRGAEPLGGGEVRFVCPAVRQIKNMIFTDKGYIKRIRGIAYSTRVSPQTANRVVEAARSILNQFTPDIYLYTDAYKGKESGLSPGFGLTLVAESTTGALISTELNGAAGMPSEDLGKECAKQLLSEVCKGGCFDSYHQWLVLLMMTMSTEDVSKTNFGKLNKFTIQYLRDLKTFFNVTFKIEPNNDDDSINITGVGIGHINVNKNVV
ncbi:hypothetical protein BB559_001965 [Furculomyces boomerangus]|uniref:RNA 3'-terminal phosphate cyclase domain-containing protein n=2 Tax=Harpellales TaxID=61421 RepID=A0A2T9YZ53_9FUNG|nr:hypothetical protein BB559_001965 [Furculomyces boomerangus]PVZ98219.1 hypothetical protein BB558_005774 [Smittium angustum]